MQFLGDEWGRQKIGPNFWVDLWKSRVTAVRGLVVVDDARYPNEFTAIREMGGFIVHVDRPTAKTKFANHASEMFHAEAGADISICNDGNMQDLQDDLIAMMANLQRKERDNATPRTNATA